MLATVELVELVALDETLDDDDVTDDEVVGALELDEAVVAPSDWVALRVTP
jgi:hypothetical protein